MLDIPVFHDDQHGTAVVALAALTNALTLTGRDPGSTRVVISGAGAAGVAVAKILLEAGITDLAVTDRKGVIHSSRGDLTAVKRSLAELPQTSRAAPARWPTCFDGADVYIGSPAARCPRSTSPRWRPTPSSSVWPTPRPRCTPRWPGATRASWPPDAPTSRTRSTTCWLPRHLPRAFDAHATAITEGMKLAAARALADLVGEALTEEYVIPSPFDPRVGPAVSPRSRPPPGRTASLAAETACPVRPATPR